MSFIREIIIKLCIYLLRKSEVSVLIGYRVGGEMHALHNRACVYDAELCVSHYLKDGSRWDISEGKFYAKMDGEPNA